MRVQEHSDRFSKYYFITGRMPEVNHQVEAIMTRYPPQGYSTSVRKPKANPDGTVTVEVERSLSCD